MSKKLVLDIIEQEYCPKECSNLVQRLLTQEEASHVSGGADYGQCGPGNPGHSMTGGSYTQSGTGGYTQSAGDYTMSCPTFRILG